MSSHFSHPSSVASEASYPAAIEIEQLSAPAGVGNTLMPADARVSSSAGDAVNPAVMDNESQQQQQADAHIADLVGSREAEVSHLQATLAVPLASWNAKFLWHSIMKNQRDCDHAFAEKIKNIHKTFYLPPAIAFYALWLHHRFWYQMPRLYHAVETHLPSPSSNGSSSSLSKATRAGIVLYMLAASLANKHLDDFSYRNSSWFEVAKMSAADFLKIELIAMEELDWSLEISPKEWREWIDLLRDANLALERTRPTMESFHWVVGGVLQETWLAVRGHPMDVYKREGSKMEVIKGSPDRLSVPTAAPGGKPTWSETSPTLVPSNGTSPPLQGYPTNYGLEPLSKHGHSRHGSTGSVGFPSSHPFSHANHATNTQGQFGVWNLHRKLEQIQAQQQFQHKPFAQALINPKFIPWDTNLDPVVRVQGRSRASSIAAPTATMAPITMTKGPATFGRNPAVGGRPLTCGDVLAFSGEEWYHPQPQPHQILKTCNAASTYYYRPVAIVGGMWPSQQL